MSNILTPDRVMTVRIGGETLKINEKIIPDGVTATKRIAAHVPIGGLIKPNRKLGRNNSGVPEGITVHNTGDISTPANTNPAEQYTRATHPNGNMSGVVVHFYVWRGIIWQNLKLDEQGWHAADGSSRRNSQRTGRQIGGNLDTIAIEAIGNHAETRATTEALVAWLCGEYNFDPRLDVYTHKYFFSGKNCPAFLIPVWGSFIDNIARILTGAAKPQPVTPPPAPNPQPTTGFKVNDIVQFGGGGVYRTSTDATPVHSRGRSRCRVTQINTRGRNPLHLVSTDGGGVHGWVVNGDVSAINTPTAITAGSRVRIRSGATYFDGKPIPSWVIQDTWIVESVNGNRAVLNRNVSGKNQIKSAINVSNLIAV